MSISSLQDSGGSLSQAFPAIYDFSLLPYALGDVLTWSVKSCIRATQKRFEQIDLYICADKQEPAFHYQKGDITTANYQSYFAELFPAFLCNPMLRDVHIFSDRQRLIEALDQIGEKSKLVLYDKLFEAAAISKGKDWLHYVNPHLKQECSGHSDINQFYEIYKSIPKLSAPRGFLPEAGKFRERLGPDAFVVCIQFRLRCFDTYLPNAEPGRDSDFVMWYEFMRIVHDRYPDVKFVLVGRLQEKPVPLLSLPNVVVPRLSGFGLGHELALMTIADLFFGTSSGFAAMANFCDVPYVITKVGDSAYANYGIPAGQSHLPFAHPDQVIVSGEENVGMLLEWFGKMYANIKTKRAPWKISAEKPDISCISASETNQVRRKEPALDYFNQVEQAIRQQRLIAIQAMEKGAKLLHNRKVPEALQELDKAWKEFPEVVARMPGFHLSRAGALQRLQRWEEAEEAVALERLYHPNNLDAWEFQTVIRYMFRLTTYSEIIKKGNEALAQDAYGLARQVFMRLTEDYPLVPEGHIGLGYACAGLNKVQAAEIAFANAQELPIADGNLLNKLGAGYFKIGDFAKAVQCFQRTLGIDTTNLEAFNNLAVIACVQNRPMEGLNYYQKALQCHPNELNLLVDYARLAKILKNNHAADVAFRKAAQLGSERPEVRQWIQENQGGYSSR